MIQVKFLRWTQYGISENSHAYIVILIYSCLCSKIVCSTLNTEIKYTKSKNQYLLQSCVYTASKIEYHIEWYKDQPTTTQFEMIQFQFFRCNTVVLKIHLYTQLFLYTQHFEETNTKNSLRFILSTLWEWFRYLTIYYTCDQLCHQQEWDTQGMECSLASVIYCEYMPRLATTGTVPDSILRSKSVVIVSLDTSFQLFEQLDGN